jgi:hypothetical protein
MEHKDLLSGSVRGYGGYGDGLLNPLSETFGRPMDTGNAIDPLLEKGLSKPSP